MSDRPVKGMGEPETNPRRVYRSRKREQASLETRRRIRAAAEALFLRDGYVRTTTKAIAREAGVAEMTLFLAFNNKAALLSEIIRTSVRGDDDDTPIAGRAVWQKMLDAPPDQFLTRFAEFNGSVQARTARILSVAEAAATTDDQLAARRDSAHAHIRADFQQIADALARQRLLPPHLSAAHAADVIYALTNPATYLLLTDERGWTTERYIDWLAATLKATLTDSNHADT
jgi:AcrR family transcriptional regulator